MSVRVHQAALRAPGARRKGEQLKLPLGNRWVGRRKRSRRKGATERGAVPHRARPLHRGYQPVHVTVRTLLRSLRSQYVFPTVRGVIMALNRRWFGRFRVVHFSAQADHLHLIVEAEDRAALLGAMRGLGVSLARRVNRLIFRQGRVVAGRWHSRPLGTPRAVRHAIVYVLGNFRKHGEGGGVIDACSSALYFQGFTECGGKAPIELEPRIVVTPLRRRGPPIEPPETWLLAIGWMRHGKISLHDSPRTTPRERLPRATSANDSP
jgi:putative transposase